jgi:hypothetical protein
MKTNQPICLFDLEFTESPRWFKGDRYIRNWIRKILSPARGKGAGGLAKVTLNLTLGLQKLGVDYQLLKSPIETQQERLFGLLHGPIIESKTLAQSANCIVGPGIINHPSEWPDLFTKYKAVYNIQNCEWAAEIYRPVYGDRVKIWTMGIDHELYAPRASDSKKIDFLIYDKIRWRDTPAYSNLLETCQKELAKAGCTSLYIRYGQYPKGQEDAYHTMLRQCKAMLFLSENETQGFAYNEALSMGVPILAWNFGKWCDPNRFNYGLDDVPATSIPYWDTRCGVDFRLPTDFAEQLQIFLEKLDRAEFSPRSYILENLRLEQGAQNYLDLLNTAQKEIDLNF